MRGLSKIDIFILFERYVDEEGMIFPQRIRILLLKIFMRVSTKAKKIGPDSSILRRSMLQREKLGNISIRLELTFIPDSNRKNTKMLSLKVNIHANQEVFVRKLASKNMCPI